MKTFDLNQMGVIELVSCEKVSISGGVPWKAVFNVLRKAVEALSALEIVQDARKGFEDGWNEAKAEDTD